MDLPRWPRERYLAALSCLDRAELVAFALGCVQHAQHVARDAAGVAEVFEALESWFSGRISDDEVRATAANLLTVTWPAAHRALYSAGSPENRRFDPATGQLREVEWPPDQRDAKLHHHCLANAVDAALSACEDVERLGRGGGGPAKRRQLEERWQDGFACELLLGKVSDPSIRNLVESRRKIEQAEVRQEPRRKTAPRPGRAKAKRKKASPKGRRSR